jgi:hypothetical protein
LASAANGDGINHELTVILSAAKDLSRIAPPDESLRDAQDDKVSSARERLPGDDDREGRDWCFFPAFDVLIKDKHSAPSSQHGFTTY